MIAALLAAAALAVSSDTYYVLHTKQYDIVQVADDAPLTTPSAPLRFAVTMPAHGGQPEINAIVCGQRYRLPPAGTQASTRLIELVPCLDVFADGFEAAR